MENIEADYMTGFITNFCDSWHSMSF